MGCCDKEKLFNSGILVEHCEGAVLPPQEQWEKKKGGYVVIECPKRIPCNPCYTSCPTGAVLPFEDINDTPRIDYSKCTGCGRHAEDRLLEMHRMRYMRIEMPGACLLRNRHDLL